MTIQLQELFMYVGTFACIAGIGFYYARKERRVSRGRSAQFAVGERMYSPTEEYGIGNLEIGQTETSRRGKQ